MEPIDLIIDSINEGPLSSNNSDFRGHDFESDDKSREDFSQHGSHMRRLADLIGI